MIVDRRAGALRLAQESLRPLAILFAWDVLVVLGFELLHRSWMDRLNLSALPFSLIGAALVLFLNVRNNSAYNRWWEARTLWGAIINNARSFGRQTASILEGAPELTRAMAAYPHALRAALRGTGGEDDLARRLPPDMVARVRERRNRPNAMLHEIGIAAHRLARARSVDAAAFAAVDRTLSELANAQGGLERIRNTPLPMQFAVLPRLLVRGFCILLPLSMVSELDWVTPLGSTVVGFLFVALDDIGADLEDPLDDSPYAIPMLSLATNVEIDLLQSVGDVPPAPVQSAGGILP